jgi:hypothetical protein
MKTPPAGVLCRKKFYSKSVAMPVRGFGGVGIRLMLD